MIRNTGVAVDDQCVTAFQDLKLKKAFRYIIYKLSSDNKQIEIEKQAIKAEYQEFVDQLPLEDCRYGVFDFEYQLSATEGQRSKICFFVWAPETSKIKQKMLYASSKDALRKKLVGISTEIQATDLSEIDYDVVLDRIKSF